MLLRCGGKRAGALLEIQADFSAQQQSDDGQWLAVFEHGAIFSYSELPSGTRGKQR